MIVLRSYQETAITECRQAFKDGHKFIIISSEGGTGKTVMFCYMAKHADSRGLRTGIFVNRQELCYQAADKLKKYGLNPYIYMQTAPPSTQKTVVASVDTCLSRGFPDFDLVIIDECHLGNFVAVLEHYSKTDAKVIGVSATPEKNSQNRILDFYTHIISTKETAQHIIDGELVNCYAVYGEDPIDSSNIKLVKKSYGMDYDEKQLYDAFNNKKMYQGLIELYIREVFGLSAMCFCINVEHSKNTAASFKAAGIPAIHLDATINPYERKKILHQFETGIYKVLCVVGIGTYGYDFPDLRCVILNRNTFSETLYRQMMTRGSRISPQTGKTHFVLLDMGTNFKRFGGMIDRPEYNLLPIVKKKKSDKEGVAPAKICPNCKAINSARQTVCVRCNYTFPVKSKEKDLKEGEFVRSFGLADVQVPPNFVKLSAQEQEEIMKKVVAMQTNMKKKDGTNMTASAIVRKLVAGKPREQYPEILKAYGRAKGYKPTWYRNVLSYMSK